MDMTEAADILIHTVPFLVLGGTLFLCSGFCFAMWLKRDKLDPTHKSYLAAGILNILIYLICGFYFNILMQSILDAKSFKFLLVAVFMSGMTASTKTLFEALNQEVHSKYNPKWFLYYVIRPTCGGAIGGVIAWALFTMVMLSGDRVPGEADLAPLLLSAASFGWLWEKVQKTLGGESLANSEEEMAVINSGTSKDEGSGSPPQAA